MRQPSHRFQDRDGAKLKIGDLVRVVGFPNLSTMQQPYRQETSRVFKRIQGTYKKIKRFDQAGNAELVFRLRNSPRGLHVVSIEPFLLKKKGGRR